MIIARHDEIPWVEWRPGVRGRVWTSALDGARSAHTGEQLMAPGTGAPLHWHYYEEHLTFLAGTAEVRVDGEVTVIEAPCTVVFLPGQRHEFVNVGDTDLHLIGSVPWPVHETLYDDADGQRFVVRGYEPGTDGGRHRFSPTGTATP
jgi:mannose-6-phosphate isomerase-like protein (cupin superfamily)